VLATVGGLIPLAMEGGPLWEPMCYVQIAGMLVATLVTLVIVPVLYVIFVEDLHLVGWESDSTPRHEGGMGKAEAGSSAAPNPSDPASLQPPLATQVAPATR
jgi:hypothetical protein